jgi:hypothetical protein
MTEPTLRVNPLTLMCSGPVGPSPSNPWGPEVDAAIGVPCALDPGGSSLPVVVGSIRTNDSCIGTGDTPVNVKII